MLDTRPLPPRTSIVLAAALAFIACTPEAPPEPETAEPAAELALALPAGVDGAAEEITEEVLRGVITELSGDGFEGRAPGSPGDAAAQSYLEAELSALGLEPGGPDGSWKQPFEIVGIEADSPATWSFRSIAGQTLDLAFQDEFIASSGVQNETAAVEGAELVFVGYGIEAPEFGWDDFKGASLAGKMLVMLNNDPDWDPALFAGERRLYYGRWTYKYESAARQGAAGAIIIHTDPSAGYPWQVVQTSWTGPQFELPAGDEPRLQIAAWTTWDATEKLFALAGHDLEELVAAAKKPDFEPMSLGIETSLSLTNQVNRGVETANILGLLPGSDPGLRDEVVIYTAHHDHLGRGKANEAGDDIYNGARDNASGTAVVMAIARAMAALPAAPRRSVLFAFVAGEEQGLLGSKHYATDPTVPAGKIAANVNFDSANIWGRTRDLTYIGLGKSSLDDVIVAAAALQGRTVLGDQFPDKGYFYRSDQFSLAKIGVPALYLSSGTDFVDGAPGEGKQRMDEWTQTHYHQPSDELDESWKFEGMVEDARVGFLAGLHIAQADEMPSWNSGDEFEAARKEALAAVGGM